MTTEAFGTVGRTPSSPTTPSTHSSRRRGTFARPRCRPTCRNPEESPIEFCRTGHLRVTASRGSRVDERSHLPRDELDKPDRIRVVGSRLEHNRIGASIRPSLHGGGERGGVPSDSDIV